MTRQQARKINGNFPKCKKCVQFGCHAGEVNHETRFGYRGCCLLCGCERFEALPREQYEELLEYAD